MFNRLSHNNVKRYLSRSLFPYLSAINILFIFNNNPYPFYYETWSECLASSRRTRQILICCVASNFMESITLHVFQNFMYQRQRFILR